MNITNIAFLILPEGSTKSQPVSNIPLPNSTHSTPNITTAVATTAVTIQASTPQPTNTPQITNPRPPMQNNLKRPANYYYQSHAMATNMADDNKSPSDESNDPNGNVLPK
ncbi:hypothetical protein FRC02_005042 [Tulasnella sp. 418]|nr:hypothetical protein FRC02_005042 [Tulasnella sp. 418]